MMICPICHQKTRLIEHHLNGRQVLDWNKSWNVAHICATDHDAVHVGEIEIEGWVSTSSGQELAWHKRGEPNKYLESATPKLYGSKKDEKE
jgi:hypothetical protein